MPAPLPTAPHRRVRPLLLGLAWLAAGSAAVAQPPGSPTATPTGTPPANSTASAPASEAIEVMVLEASVTPAARGVRTADVYALFVNVEATEVLCGADSAVAERVELVGADGKARPFSDFSFREDVETRLTPDLHLRLVGLKHPLQVGDPVLVTMHFEEGGHLDLRATVRTP